MAPVNMIARDAAFIISEAEGHRSRDTATITVPANATFEAGTVLGKVTSTGKFVRHDTDGTDNGTRQEAGILYASITNATGSAADFTSVVMTRDMEVDSNQLTYEDGADAAAKTASNVALASLGIIVR